MTNEAHPSSELARAPMSGAIDAVVFDIGGVLIDWNPRHLYRKLLAHEQVERFLTEVCTRDWNRCQDLGRTIEQGTRELLERHPDERELIAAYYGRWEEMLGGEIGASVDLLHELHAVGMPLYALTNWSHETFRIVRREYAFVELFDGIVVSGEERLAKPDERIFRVLLDRYGLQAGSVLFIDDSADNVRSAQRCGLQTLLFRSPHELRGDLARLGLALSEVSLP
jgi:2-haloacid dehalogenase